MTTRDPKKLIEKLGDHLARGLEAGAGFCVSRGHYEVTLEHLLLKLIEEGSGDIPRVFSNAGVDDGPLWGKLLERLEGFRAGNTGRPSFSPQLLDRFEAAWVVASVHHGADRARSGHLLEALLADEALALGGWDDAFGTLTADDVRANFAAWTAGSSETGSAGARRSTAAAADGAGRAGTALEKYAQNVTDDAREGRIDMILGRDNEIRQAIDILSRRRKNNPILVGEAGVGKTAVVEGLALRIAQGDVPDSLRDVELVSLDLGALQAGAGMKGEFEERLKGVIRDITEAPRPTILFIDEAHTLIGAGGSAGTGDAANLLKPALARGELRTIAATTWSEYKKHIEKDPALARRFQLIKIEEPTEDVAAGMLRGIKGKYEEHHRVRITDDAVAATARLSHRYISGRQLPDKAVDLLDTAAARVKMTQSSKPAALEDVERRLAAVDRRSEALRRDAAAGLRAPGEEEAALAAERGEVESRRVELVARWGRERDVAASVEAARAALADGAAPRGDGAAPDAAAMDARRAELNALRAELTELQGETPLVHAEVNESVVAQVVSDWTGIPIGDMVKDEAALLLAMEQRLGARVEGQPEAIGEISDSLRAAKAGMGNPEAPLGVFLLVGPSGVGKTETARALAELLFGGERFLISINMSEYQEAHTVSQLKGSPPGYVGYGEGGVLTEAVRQRPYAVVLLDEVEKAHGDVMELFFQVFDRGILRDGEGREITFANTVILATSNVGTELIAGASRLPERPSMDDVREAVHEDLIQHFAPALLGRMKVVPFFSLSADAMARITRLKLDKIDRRLRAAHGVRFVYPDAVVDRIAERCTQVDAGARNIDFIIDRSVLPDASRALLQKMAEGAALPAALVLGVDDAGVFTYTFTDDPDAAVAPRAAPAKKRAAKAGAATTSNEPGDEPPAADGAPAADLAPVAGTEPAPSAPA